MKKIFKYGLFSVLATVAMASCTDEYKYDAADPVTNQNEPKATIEAEEVSYTYEGDEAETFTFNVTRQNSDKAESVDIECDNPRVTLDKTTVDFAAGETSKEVKGTTSLEVGEKITCTVKVADKNADIYSSTDGHYMQEFTLFHDYPWTDAGSCTFIDYTFSEGKYGANDVKIQQYSADKNTYRIVKPFEAALGAEGSDNIVFYVKDDGSAKSLKAGNIKLNVGNYTLTYYASGNYASYCTFTNQGKQYGMTMIISNGSQLGVAQFYFIWDEGCPYKAE